MGVGRFFIVIICGLIFTSSFGQQRLYFYAETKNTIQEELLVTHKEMKRVFIFYENFFMNKNKFDKKLFNQFCDKIIPNKYQVGFVVLDLENGHFDLLKGVKNSKNQNLTHRQALNLFIEIIEFAKKVRPNMKWSFYDIVPAIYPRVNRDMYSNLDPLLKRIDFFTTSLYLRQHINDLVTQEYLESNVVNALKLSSLYNKPLMPFIWHRYHDRKSSNRLILEDDFRNYIDKILNVRFNKRKVDGVIWWNSESFIYRSKSSNKYYSEEYRRIKDKNLHQRNIFKNYINVFSDLIKLR